MASEPAGSDSFASAAATNPQAPGPQDPGRPPQAVGPGLWLFAPNRDSQGGSAWLLEAHHADLLIDVPALTEANLSVLRQRASRRPPGAERWIVLTGRHGHGRCRRLQEALGWTVVVQEQEAYLLPGLQSLQTFGPAMELGPGLRLLWTPGSTPGACVLHAKIGRAHV